MNANVFLSTLANTFSTATSGDDGESLIVDISIALMQLNS